jgi:NAD(P)H-flavin reductase
MTNEQLKGITDRARRIEANKPPNLEWQVVTKDIPAMIAEIKRLTVEQDAVHRQGMDRMQQAIIDLLNEHNAPLHLIARIVEMEYP